MFNYDNCVTVPLCLKYNRLRCACRFQCGGLFSGWLRCCIDTGAVKTVVPEIFWARHPKLLHLSQPLNNGVDTTGGIRITKQTAKLGLQVAGWEAPTFPVGHPKSSSKNIIDRSMISLGICDVVLSADEKADPKHILLGLDALMNGGICVNYRTGDAHLIVDLDHTGM